MIVSIELIQKKMKSVIEKSLDLKRLIRQAETFVTPMIAQIKIPFDLTQQQAISFLKKNAVKLKPNHLLGEWNMRSPGIKAITNI